MGFYFLETSKETRAIYVTRIFFSNFLHSPSDLLTLGAGPVVSDLTPGTLTTSAERGEKNTPDRTTQEGSGVDGSGVRFQL